jgi:hypothetical protein
MKTISSWLLLAIVFGAADCTAKPPNIVEKVPEQYRALFMHWLSQDCRVDAEAIVKDMIVAGPVLEEPLWAAFEQGPGQDERADLQNALGERYALRYRWLMQNSAECVKAPDTAALLEEPEERFRATEMEKLDLRWRDAAIGGLALVCTERSLERLTKLAQDEENPSSLAARVALEDSGNCSRAGARR